MKPPTNTSLIVDFVCEALLPHIGQEPLRHLDVSAGWGHLIRRLKAARPLLLSEACDYPLTPELGEIPAREVNLHHGVLPYDDESFDLVTCTEAFEHIESFQPIIREMFRILKPGGLVMISTPNILSFRSRLKFLFRGSYEFFDPLSTAKEMGSWSWMRHINPITFVHLCLALVDAGFQKPKHYPGKVQKLAAAFYWLTPFFRWNANSARLTRIRKGRPVTPLCEELAAEQNSWNIFTSRTLIVSATKPAEADKPHVPVHAPAPSTAPL